MKYLRRAFHLVFELMRELADERPYQRHLQYHGRTHSPQEWRRFHESRLLARYVRPKCC